MTTLGPILFIAGIVCAGLVLLWWLAERIDRQKAGRRAAIKQAADRWFKNEIDVIKRTRAEQP